MHQSQDPRAVSAQQQQELKQTLREAFAGNDGVNCWAWVIFDHEVTVSATNEAASDNCGTKSRGFSGISPHF